MNTCPYIYTYAYDSLTHVFQSDFMDEHNSYSYACLPLYINHDVIMCNYSRNFAYCIMAEIVIQSRYTIS